MPVFVDIEASCKVPELFAMKTRSGGKHTETSTEFARRMRDRFVLHGPREQKEGESTHQNPKTTQIPPAEESNSPIVTQDPGDNSNRSAEPEQMRPVANENSPVTPEVRADSLPNGVQASAEASLLAVLAAGRLKLDLENLLQSHYSSDVLFKKVMDQPKDFRNFEVDK
ncbi:hypothetical protein AAF712_016880, partial [Marasmius tenuissimus]